MILRNKDTRTEIRLDKRIGRGYFSDAFLGEDGFIYCLVNTDQDPSKEAISLFCSDMPHIPCFKRIWGFERMGKRHGGIVEYHIYRSPLYQPLPNGSEKKRMVALLNKIAFQSWGEFISKYRALPIYFSDRVEMILRDFREAKIPESLVEAIQEIAYAGMNYHSFINLEFYPRNIKIDENGEIILLDILVPFIERKMRK